MAKANSTRPRRLQALPAQEPATPPERPRAAPPPEPHPLADLETAEAIVDLVRIGVANDFASSDGTEARQESGAASLAHVLYLIRSARLSLADTLAKASPTSLARRTADTFTAWGKRPDEGRRKGRE